MKYEIWDRHVNDLKFIKIKKNRNKNIPYRIAGDKLWYMGKDNMVHSVSVNEPRVFYEKIGLRVYLNIYGNIFIRDEYLGLFENKEEVSARNCKDLLIQIFAKLKEGDTIETLEEYMLQIERKVARKKVYSEFEQHVIGNPSFDYVRDAKKNVTCIHTEVVLSKNTDKMWIQKHQKEVIKYIISALEKRALFQKGTYQVNWFNLDQMVILKAAPILRCTFVLKDSLYSK